MSPKQSVLELVQKLPDTATMHEIAAEVELMRRIEAAEADIANGRYYTHAEVMAHLLEAEALPSLPRPDRLVPPLD
jgi:predicted transcriptional regulator